MYGLALEFTLGTRPLGGLSQNYWVRHMDLLGSYAFAMLSAYNGNITNNDYDSRIPLLAKMVLTTPHSVARGCVPSIRSNRR